MKDWIRYSIFCSVKSYLVFRVARRSQDQNGSIWQILELVPIITFLRIVRVNLLHGLSIVVRSFGKNTGILVPTIEFLDVLEEIMSFSEIHGFEDRLIGFVVTNNSSSDSPVIFDICLHPFRHSQSLVSHMFDEIPFVPLDILEDELVLCAVHQSVAVIVDIYYYADLFDQLVESEERKERDGRRVLHYYYLGSLNLEEHIET